MAIDSNLLKEAIADAKAVRQTALANAKVALEEAFSERYHAMFAEKLKEEAAMDDKSMTAAPEQTVSEQEIDELIKELEAEVGDENPEAPVGSAPEAPAPEVPPVDAAAPALDGAGAPLTAGQTVKLVPVDAAAEVPPVAPEAPAATPPSDVPPVAGAGEDEDVNLDELLESLKNEIEGEEKEEKLDEDKKLSSSAIAPGGNKKPSASASSSSGIESGGMKSNGMPESTKVAADPTDVTKPEVNFGKNKDGNLATTPSVKEGIALKNKGVPEGKVGVEDATEAPRPNSDGKFEDTAKLTNENAELQKQLNEAVEVIKYVKSQLNEVNLLNAKLLYTNKLFKEYNMNNEQKMRVVEMFDLSKNVREVKLTYANIAEAMNFSGTEKKKNAPAASSSVQSITEGLASKPVGSTKPSKEIISEGKTSAAVLKFQKLAGIKRA